MIQACVMPLGLGIPVIANRYNWLFLWYTVAKQKALPPQHLSSRHGAQAHRSHFILTLLSYNTYIIHAYLNQDIRQVPKSETVKHILKIHEFLHVDNENYCLLT